ncbi:MAG: tetratricopeptide repeat protein [Bacteroidetes bacterium]|nr:tetratricopeptide repeat protein [Bacteroidota bacterium]MBU1718752.1 tetratricopeptide repeat protein [Bacteroidota bacterium]
MTTHNKKADRLLGKTTISPALLERYLTDTATEQERNLVEMAATSDPLLAEALEGYSLHPESFDYYKKNVTGNPIRPSGSFSRLLIVGFVVIIALRAVWYLTQDEYPTQTASRSLVTLNEVYLSRDVAGNPKIPEQVITYQKTIMDQRPTPEGTSTLTQIELPANETIPAIYSKEVVFDKEKNKKIICSYLNIYYLYDLKLADYTGLRNKGLKKNPETGGLDAKYANPDDLMFDNITGDLPGETVTPYKEFLTDAMLLYSKNKYADAQVYFRKILDQYADDLNALFYGGLCYYNSGRAQSAIRNFQQIVVSGNAIFGEEAEWYLGLSFFVSGEKIKANNIFKKIAEGEGFYSERAAERLRNQN